MTNQQDIITMELDPQTANPDSSYSNSKKTTVVETYPVASQSTLNVDGTDHNDDFHLELRPTEESAEPIWQGWISYSREMWMVGCFAVMTMMVALDAMIFVPILPVSPTLDGISDVPLFDICFPRGLLYIHTSF